MQNFCGLLEMQRIDVSAVLISEVVTKFSLPKDNGSAKEYSLNQKESSVE